MIRTEDNRNIRNTIRNRLVATVFLVLVCCCTLIAAAKAGYTVNVVADGKSVMVKTSEENTDIILQQAGVSLGEDDKLDTSAFAVGKSADDGNELVVLRAVKVTIFDDGEEVATVNVAGTVSDALEKAGVNCRKVDKLNCDRDDSLEKNMKIEITRAFSVDVTADGKTNTVDFLDGTVRDVLKELEIELGENDEVNLSLDAQLKPGYEIKVYRVTYEERTESEVIKYKTVNTTSASLYKGTTQVEQEGKNGEKTVVYKDKLMDGKVVSSTKVSEDIVTPATDKIVVTGTKIKILAQGAPISSLSLSYGLNDGIPTNPITTISGKASAYTSSTGKSTASGVCARSGYVAVNPSQIPYGTEMYIVSEDGRYVYGFAIAADTGGFATNGSGRVVDLYMDTLSECNQWGVRNVCIYILKWGNGSV